MVFMTRRALVLMLPAFSSAALAQSSPSLAAGTSSAAAAEADPGLADIVVTAQKRSENLQRVPIAIAVQTGAQLAAVGVTNTMQLNLVFSGTNIRNSVGNFQPFVRGIGTTAAQVENPVALYIDGVYFPVQREGARELVDLEQLAVLKGPQGTLFGRNATGGVVQITTREPGSTLDLDVSGGIDNYETLRGSVYLAGPLSDGLKANISASYVTQGRGWGDNITTGGETYKVRHDLSLRSKWVVEPSDRAKIVAIIDYLDKNDRNIGYRPVEGTRPIVSGFIDDGKKYELETTTPDFLKLKSGGASLNAQYDLDFARIVSISSYRRGQSRYQFDAIGVPSPSQGLAQTNRFRFFTQELQLISTGSGPLTWAAGLYYFHYNEEVDPVTITFAGPLAPLPTSSVKLEFRSAQKVRSIAGYMQATLAVTPTTKITLGGRYTSEQRDLAGSKNALLKNGTFIPALVPPIVASISANRPTWRIAVDQQLSDNVLAYASFNRGFKSGGFSMNDPSNPPYKPETLDAYEVGLKSELFDRRVRLNLAGFYYDYTNVQVSRYLTSSIITNGAAARVYGLDLDYEVKLTSALRLSGGLELLSAKFTDYPSAACSTPRPTGGQTLFTCSAKGNRLPWTQPFTMTTMLDYEKPVSFGTLNFAISNSYGRGFHTEADNRLYEKPFDILNTSVAWTSLGGAWSVRLWASNLFNEVRATQKYTAGSFAYVVNYGSPPRRVGITVSRKFGE